MEDVVYLKNGSILRGTIIEHIPGQSLTMQVAGSVLVYTMEEIAKTTREPVMAMGESPGDEGEAGDTDIGTLGPAQIERTSPRGEWGMFVDLASPVGEFQDHVDAGYGFGGAYLLFLDKKRRVDLRAEGNYVIYGRESSTVPLSTVVFVDVDVKQTTTNSILFLGLGPQVYLGSGPIRPYFSGTVGYARFATETSIRVKGESDEDEEDDDEIASTTNHKDGKLALSAGGGISVRIGAGLYLDFSAFFQQNGQTEYLANGAANLRHLPDGSWAVDPIRSEANLVTFRIGLIFTGGPKSAESQ